MYEISYFVAEKVRIVYSILIYCINDLTWVGIAQLV